MFDGAVLLIEVLSYEFLKIKYWEKKNKKNYGAFLVSSKIQEIHISKSK